jgi:hypothetical protein
MRFRDFIFEIFAFEVFVFEILSIIPNNKVLYGIFSRFFVSEIPIDWQYFDQRCHLSIEKKPNKTETYYC